MTSTKKRWIVEQADGGLLIDFPAINLDLGKEVVDRGQANPHSSSLLRVAQAKAVDVLYLTFQFVTDAIKAAAKVLDPKRLRLIFKPRLQKSHCDQTVGNEHGGGLCPTCGSEFSHFKPSLNPIGHESPFRDKGGQA